MIVIIDTIRILYVTYPAPQPKSDDPFIDAAITGVGGQPFVLGACMFRQYSPRRGTCVIDIDGGSTVIKFSWLDESLQQGL